MDSQQAETLPQPSQNNQPRRRSSTVPWAIAIASLVTCAVLSFFLYKSLTISSGTVQPAPVKENNATEQASASGVETREAKYHAVIGKYSIKLPSEYYIIVDHDGKALGGYDITQLRVVKAKDINNHLLTGNMTGNGGVLINSSKSNIGAYTLQDGVNAATRERVSTPQPDVTIDGITGKSFVLSGHGSEEVIVFENKGVVHTITAVDSDLPEVKQALQQVITGLKFD